MPTFKAFNFIFHFLIANYCMHYNCVKESYSNTKCFPNTAIVQIFNQEDNSFQAVTIDKLQIGDKILTYAPNHNEIVVDDVIGFLHKEIASNIDFLFIQTETNSLQISPTHLLFIRNGTSFQEKMASELQVGDVIAILNNQEIKYETLTSISMTKGNDLYAPLTRTGTLLGLFTIIYNIWTVNNIFVSCYTSFKYQQIAHYSFLPYRVITSILTAHFLDYYIDHINWYAWILMQISKHMPSGLNYQEQNE